jgi:hypothetical protein
VYKAAIKLRKSHPVFTGDDFTYSLNGAVKSLKLNDPSMDAVVIVNIDVNPQDKTIDFQHNGWWYEYFSGDSIQINGTSIISLDPGDYKVFTDLKLDKPEILNTLNIDEYQFAEWETNLFPNPVIDFLQVEVKKCKHQPIKFSIIDPLGKLMIQEIKNHSDLYSFNLSKLKSGNYFILIEQGKKIKLHKFLKE